MTAGGLVARVYEVGGERLRSKVRLRRVRVDHKDRRTHHVGRLVSQIKVRGIGAGNRRRATHAPIAIAASFASLLAVRRHNPLPTLPTAAISQFNVAFDGKDQIGAKTGVTKKVLSR